MPTPNRSTVVVFDLGNVLIRWDPFPSIAAGVGEQAARAMLTDAEFDFAAWNHEQDGGRDWDSAQAQVAEQFPRLADAVRAYRANFEMSMLGSIEGSVALLRELLDAGVAVYALTNWSAELFPLARKRFEFLGWFADIIVSGEEGVAKPDPRLFDVLCDRIGAEPTRVLLIDDIERNVAAAQRYGLDAVRFTDPVRLRADLRDRGLPVAAS